MQDSFIPPYCPYRVLACISKMTTSKTAIQKFLPVQIYFRSLYQLYLIAYCVKKGYLYVLEDGLLGRYLVITPKKSKLKNLHRNLCLSTQVAFWELPVQKTGRASPGQVPAIL